MKKQYLILGATGSIGYGFTRVLLAAGEAVTILVRDRNKATEWFGQPENLTIIEGDRAGAGAKVLRSHAGQLNIMRVASPAVLA